MDKLWAPWRIKYVAKKKRRGCTFCRIAKDKNDKKNFIVLRSSHCFIVLNTFPYNNGHLMIVPNRHIKDLERLSDGELLDMNKTLIKAKLSLDKILKPDGFNIGINIAKAAGAGIDNHIHIHIVSRWVGDTNFMPALSNTKVISQSLKELYSRLKKRL